jgi:hypothetical protein
MVLYTTMRSKIISGVQNIQRRMSNWTQTKHSKHFLGSNPQDSCETLKPTLGGRWSRR